MIPASQMAGMRSTKRRTMGAACVITRGGGRPTYDKDTRTTTAPTPTTIYTGPCRILQPSGDRRPEVGGEPVVQHDLGVGIPHDAPEVLVEDRVKITSAGDSQLVDRSLRVADVTHREILLERILALTDDLG